MNIVILFPHHTSIPMTVQEKLPCSMKYSIIKSIRKGKKYSESGNLLVLHTWKSHHPISFSNTLFPFSFHIIRLMYTVKSRVQHRLISQKLYTIPKKPLDVFDNLLMAYYFLQQQKTQQKLYRSTGPMITGKLNATPKTHKHKHNTFQTFQTLVFTIILCCTEMKINSPEI